MYTLLPTLGEPEPATTFCSCSGLSFPSRKAVPAEAAPKAHAGRTVSEGLGSSRGAGSTGPWRQRLPNVRGSVAREREA